MKCVLRDLHDGAAVGAKVLIGFGLRRADSGQSRGDLLIHPALEPGVEIVERRRFHDGEAVALRRELIDEKDFCRNRERAGGVVEDVDQERLQVDISSKRKDFRPETEEGDEVIVHRRRSGAKYGPPSKPGLKLEEDRETGASFAPPMGSGSPANRSFRCGKSSRSRPVRACSCSEMFSARLPMTCSRAARLRFARGSTSRRSRI